MCGAAAYEMLGSFSEMINLKATMARRSVMVMEQRSAKLSTSTAKLTKSDDVMMKSGSTTLSTQ